MGSPAPAAVPDLLTRVLSDSKHVSPWSFLLALSPSRSLSGPLESPAGAAPSRGGPSTPAQG